MLPFVGQLPFPNTPQQVFFVRTTDAVVQSCKTQNILVSPVIKSATVSYSSRNIFSYFTDRHKRSMKILSIQRPLPSMLILIPLSFRERGHILNIKYRQAEFEGIEAQAV
jgi:hypothetical protein